jgi:hypothetical protein
MKKSKPKHNFIYCYINYKNNKNEKINNKKVNNK